MEDPVPGTAKVLTCSEYRGEHPTQSCGMYVVVQAAGVPATAVEHSEIVHSRHWPAPGMTLPVTLDRGDPQRLRIEWDDVPSSPDREVHPEEMDERLDRLSQLTELRDRGALTDAEFEAEKRRILKG